jgi:hypothetical protein
MQRPVDMAGEAPEPVGQISSQTPSCGVDVTLNMLSRNRASLSFKGSSLVLATQ